MDSRTRRSLPALFLVPLLLVLALAVPASAANVSEATSLDEILSADDYTEDDAKILRLYRAFLDREPDVDGAKYWIQVARDGATEDDIAFGFRESVEFAAVYGDLDDEAFLTQLYLNMLDREADADGYEYWLGQMERGLTQWGVVRWVVANDEFIMNYPYAPMDPPASTTSTTEGTTSTTEGTTSTTEGTTTTTEGTTTTTEELPPIECDLFVNFPKPLAEGGTDDGLAGLYLKSGNCYVIFEDALGLNGHQGDLQPIWSNVLVDGVAATNVEGASFLDRDVTIPPAAIADDEMSITATVSLVHEGTEYLNMTASFDYTYDAIGEQWGRTGGVTINTLVDPRES